MLVIYTVTHAYLVSAITILYAPDTVMCAAVCTCGMFVALTIYACFTEKDMTKHGGALSVFTFELLLFLIFFGFTNVPIVRVAIIMVVLILMSAWLVHDTQLIIGGKYDELEMDDYVIGALLIYSDILTIFLYLLKLFGGD